MASNITPVQVLPGVSAPNPQIAMAAFPARVWDFSTIFKGIEVGMQKERLAMDRERLELQKADSESQRSIQQANLRLNTMKYYGDVSKDFMGMNLLPRTDLENLYSKYGTSAEDLANASGLDDMMGAIQKMTTMLNDPLVRQGRVDREAFDLGTKQLDEMITLFSRDPVLASEIDFDTWSKNLETFQIDPEATNPDGTRITRKDLTMDKYIKTPEMQAYLAAMKQGNVDKMNLAKEQLIGAQTENAINQLKLEEEGLRFGMMKKTMQEYMDQGMSATEAYQKTRTEYENIHYSDKWHQIYNDLLKTYNGDVETAVNRMTELMVEANTSTHYSKGDGTSGRYSPSSKNSTTTSQTNQRLARITDNAKVNDYYDKDGALSKTGRAAIAKDYFNNTFTFTNGKSGTPTNFSHESILLSYDPPKDASTPNIVDFQYERPLKEGEENSSFFGLINYDYKKVATNPISSSPHIREYEQNNQGIPSEVTFRASSSLGDEGFMVTNNRDIIQGMLDDGVITKDQVQYEVIDYEYDNPQPGAAQKKLNKKIVQYKIPVQNNNTSFFKSLPESLKDSKRTLNYRNLNPLNLRPDGNGYYQQKYSAGTMMSESSGEFLVFNSMEEGLQANLENMDRYYTGQNATLRRNRAKWGRSNEPITLKDLIYTWAPVSDNSERETKGYFNKTKELLGITSEDVPLSELNKEDLAVAMMYTEGRNAYEYFTEKRSKGYGLLDPWPGQMVANQPSEAPLAVPHKPGESADGGFDIGQREKKFEKEEQTVKEAGGSTTVFDVNNYQ